MVANILRTLQLCMKGGDLAREGNRDSTFYVDFKHALDHCLIKRSFFGQDKLLAPLLDGISRYFQSP